ncbi:MAG TPA: SgcJ/EcaC family oxidoreductase [Polaromonas sp.]
MNAVSTVALTIGCLAVAGCASISSGSGSSPQRTEACVSTNEREIAALFDRWNDSLKTGDPHKVVANYAARSVLLPTVSNKPRLTPEEKEDYFHHFLENKPVGQIDSRTIEIGCTTAVDSGLYTFTFSKTGAQVKARYTYTYKWDGTTWLITSHHSSAMPEKQ